MTDGSSRLTLYERIVRAVRTTQEKSSGTQFPTVRRLAQRLNVRQSEIEDAIEGECGPLYFTSYGADCRLGDRFVEIDETGP